MIQIQNTKNLGKNQNEICFPVLDKHFFLQKAKTSIIHVQTDKALPVLTGLTFSPASNPLTGTRLSNTWSYLDFSPT